MEKNKINNPNTDKINNYDEEEIKYNLINENIKESNIVVPKFIFIVPYRNRIEHRIFFNNYLCNILDNTTSYKNNYEIYFSHQCDSRTFNRGATKNIGFIAMKKKYSQFYKNITFVFNDVDTIPFTNILDYETEIGVVKHFYGFKYALGGIFSIKGVDFEKTNGFPNFWGWGMEDNVLQTRCEKVGLKIDRSNFYPIGSPKILHLFDGVNRIINRKDPWRATNDDYKDGLITINELNYSIDKLSENPNDNLYPNIRDYIYFINIKTFLTNVRFESQNYYNYDLRLRYPKREIIHPNLIKTKSFINPTNDWSNIPYYPTIENRKNMEKIYTSKEVEEIIQLNDNINNMDEKSNSFIKIPDNIKNNKIKFSSKKH